MDIRAHRAGRKFTIHHGPCNQLKTFDDVIADIKNFLRKYPTETVFMNLQEEWDAEKNSESFSRIFNRYKNANPSLFYTGRSIKGLKLRDVRGKIVIITNNNIGLGIKTTQPDIDYQNDYHFYDVNKKWSLVKNHLIEAKNAKGDGRLYITFTSANGMKDPKGLINDLKAGKVKGMPTPKDFANKISPKLRNFLNNNPKGRYGVILMDFPRKENILKIIKSN